MLNVFTNLGTQIRVNKGEIETLISIEKSFGLFKSESGYLVVRNLNRLPNRGIINDKEIRTIDDLLL